MGTWKEKAASHDISGAVLQYIGENQYVSFAELQKRFKDYLEVGGSMALCFGSDENLVLWGGLSEDFLQVLQQVIMAKQVHMHPSTPLIYAIDGALTSLPLARRPPKGGYKDPHWMPVTLCTFPPKAEKKRSTRN